MREIQSLVQFRRSHIVCASHLARIEAELRATRLGIESQIGRTTISEIQAATVQAEEAHIHFMADQKRREEEVKALLIKTELQKAENKATKPEPLYTQAAARKKYIDSLMD